MARRHKSLIPLSKDHYEGLLLSQQIQADRVMMNGWPPDLEGRARFVARFYDEHLTTHFKAEEESLFPLITAHIPDGSSIVDELLNEHRTIERFVQDFASGNATSQRLKEFGLVLEGHIRKEERQLFPLFEAQATAETLSQAERDILRHYPEENL